MLMHNEMMIMLIRWNVNACLTPRCYIDVYELIYKLEQSYRIWLKTKNDLQFRMNGVD